MKKTITVNLNGRVFTMDEDAYQLLDNYLKNLRIYFRREEDSAEIINDFEARIEELLSEKLRLGKEVIAISDIEEVISQMGNPSDFTEDEPGRADEAREDWKVYDDSSIGKKKRFFRNPDDKMIGGVCSGIAAYFGWEVLPIRIIFILLLFATSFWFSVPYIILWMIVPMAYTAEEKLQMRGQPITVENIGKTVAAEAEPKETGRGFLNGLTRFFAGFFKILLITMCIILGIPLVFAGIIMIVVLLALLFGIGNGVIFGVDLAGLEMYSNYPVWAMVCLSLVVLIPIISIVYSLVAYLAKFNPLHSSVKWLIALVWLAALIAFILLGIGKGGKDWNDFRHHYRWTETVKGNRIASDKLLSFPLIRSVELNGRLAANLEIVQREGDETCLYISADDNLIDKIDAQLTDEGKLKLNTKKRYRFRGQDDIRFVLQTPDLDKVELEGFGSVWFNGPFRTEELQMKIEGAGSIDADSLYVYKIKTQTNGAGNINLGGKSVISEIEISGIGNVNADEMQSDSIYINVNMMGNVECNPLQLLDATVNGVGEVLYRGDPAVMRPTINGVGSIRKK